MAMQGKLITLEGTEGVGKSTQLRYVEDWLVQRSVSALLTREPGGTPLAEQLRDLLLNHDDATETIASDTELLLMMAARAQHWHGLIQPALAQGQWVVSDRYADASVAYQGFGRGLAVERIEALIHWLLGAHRPHLTFWLDLPVEQGMARAKARATTDRFEQQRLDFFHRVHAGYAWLHQTYPDRIKRIDASVDADGVFVQIQEHLQTLWMQCS